MTPRSKPATTTPATLSAGVVVVRETGDGWRVLLLRAYNYWDCPKGLVEPGEDPLTTAKREVREETGIEDLDFRWGEQHVETPRYSNHKIARYYLAHSGTAKIHLPLNPELGRAEHHEARWVDFAAGLALTVSRVGNVLRWARDIVESPKRGDAGMPTG